MYTLTSDICIHFCILPTYVYYIELKKIYFSDIRNMKNLKIHWIGTDTNAMFKISIIWFLFFVNMITNATQSFLLQQDFSRRRQYVDNFIAGKFFSIQINPHKMAP